MPSPAGSVLPMGANIPAMPDDGSVSRIACATSGSSHELKNVVFRIIDVQPVEASACASSATIVYAVKRVHRVAAQLRRYEHAEHTGGTEPCVRSGGTHRAASVGRAIAHLVPERVYCFEVVMRKPYTARVLLSGGWGLR